MNLPALIEAQWSRLTANQQKIADYVLTNPFPVATMGIEELASATETSTATITRFVKALGLNGYTEFRAHAVQGYQSLLKPVENIDRARHIPPRRVIKDSFKNALSQVQTVAQQADNPVWESAAMRIQSAQRIAFLGFGVSGNLLQLFADRLLPFSRAQIMLTGENGMERVALKIAGLGPEDLLIAMALPRYSQHTVDFMKLARGRGTYCIAVTDGAHSPLCALSQEQVFIPADHPVLHSSGIAALAAFETILAVLAAHHQSVSDAVTRTRFLMPYFYADDKDHPQSKTRTTDVSEAE
ncbi:MurR/RpiR family transcriptional regulator [Pseudochrobactrum sp. sp1633]|uniref:MurR/RpiR family transcriptional regulator n=1 Tax=Pseudochrobactrum sp. sp1633 TaxID=3036706 RepID=UPI0025A51ADD|nr:MurR/RpiR family transcriptional regulator [Pseudochrobactrum sp. sp1633]MDM8346871.1 MurR/RpiR family transcriptional regulator [Pseudochrobactrum sp. sp1633]HWD12592.1 MurR/RpiR family transcriptional regulator [Pseudochrobactrum sp.]